MSDLGSLDEKVSNAEEALEVVTNALQWKQVLCHVDASPLCVGRPTALQPAVELTLSLHDTLEDIKQKSLLQLDEEQQEAKEGKRTKQEAKQEIEDTNVLVFGLKDCSMQGIEKPEWVVIGTENELHAKVQTWLLNAEVYKSRIFAEQIWRVGEELRMLLANHNEEDKVKEDKRRQACKEFWGLLLSEQAGMMHAGDSRVEAIVGGIVEELEYDKFWALGEEVQVAVLGIIWAASRHADVRKKIAKETKAVQYLFDLVREYGSRTSFKQTSERFKYILGCLTGLVCDDSVALQFEHKAFLENVDLMFWVLKKSQEHQNWTYLDLTVRVLSHLVLSDFAFEQSFLLKERCLNEVFASIDVSKHSILPSHLLCHTNILANLTRKRDFCKKLMRKGFFEQILNIIEWIQGVLESKEELARVKSYSNAVEWEEDTGDDSTGTYGTTADDTARYSVERLLVESYLRCLGILWSCCKAQRTEKRSTAEHQCAHFYASSCSLFPQVQNEDVLHVELDANRLQIIARICFPALKHQLLVNVNGQGAKCKQALEQLQALALSTLETILELTWSGARALFHSPEFTNFVVGLASTCTQTRTTGTYSRPSTVFQVKGVGLHCLCGPNAEAAAFQFVKSVLVTGQKCQSAFVYCRANFATMSTLTPQHVEFVASTALFCKRLSIDQLGLEFIVGAIVSKVDALELQRSCNQEDDETDNAAHGTDKSTLERELDVSVAHHMEGNKEHQIGEEEEEDDDGDDDFDEEDVEEKSEKHRESDTENALSEGKERENEKGDESDSKHDPQNAQNSLRKSKKSFRELAKSVIEETRVASFFGGAHRTERNVAASLNYLAAQKKGLRHTLSSSRIKLCTDVNPKAVNMATLFLNRLAQSRASSMEIKAVISHAQVFLTACAFGKGPQSSTLLSQVIDLCKVPDLRAEAFFAVWFFARNNENRERLASAHFCKLALNFLRHTAASQDNYFQRLRALQAIWLAIYDHKNLVQFFEYKGVESVAQILKDPANTQAEFRFVCLQILRVCATKYAKTSVSNATYLSEGFMLETVWNTACNESEEIRVRCAAASLLCVLPIPDVAAEKSLIALVRTFLWPNSNPTEFRPTEGRSPLVIHAAYLFAHVQFSIEGHALLRKLKVLELLLCIAIDSCNLVWSDRLPPCSCPPGTAKTYMQGRCSFCNVSEQLRATLMAILNLAIDEKTQEFLCKYALTQLLQMAWTVKSEQHQQLVAQVLNRIASNPQNQTQVYDLELRARKALCFAAKKTERQMNSPLEFLMPSSYMSGSSVDSASFSPSLSSESQHLMEDSRASDADKRRGFLQWFRELNGKAPNYDNMFGDQQQAQKDEQELEDKDRDILQVPAVSSISLTTPESQSLLLQDLVLKKAGKKVHGEGSSFWKAIREPKRDLWKATKGDQLRPHSSQSSSRWKPSVRNVKSKSDRLVVELADTFPHSTYKFTRSKARSLKGISAQEKERHGVCELFSFPHVKGSRVYKDSGMQAYQVSMDPSLSLKAATSPTSPSSPNSVRERLKEEEAEKATEFVFLYRKGGSIQPMDHEEVSIQQHLYGTPNEPIELIDLESCCITLSNPACRPLDLSNLVQMDLLPKAARVPQPDAGSIDEDLLKKTAFPLLLARNRSITKLRTISLAKLHSFLSTSTSARSTYRSMETTKTLFESRKFESDSQSLFGITEEVAAAAFDVDWSISMQRKNFYSYIFSIAVRDSTDTGHSDASAPLTLKAIATLLRENYRILCVIYRFYSSLTIVSASKGGKKLENMEHVKEESLLQLCRDAKIMTRGGITNSLTSRDSIRQMALQLFSKGVQAKQLTRVQRQAVRKCKAINFTRLSGLHRHGFLEFILRVADMKYYKQDTGTKQRSMINSLSQLFEKNLKPLVKANEMQLDPDQYRRQRLYKNGISEVLTTRHALLEQLFDMFAGVSRDTQAWGGCKGRRLALPEWFAMLEHLNLYSPYFTFREAAMIFKASAFEVVDLAQDWEKQLSLSFTAFLEAICRTADAFFLPPDFLLERYSFSHVREFYFFVSRLDLWEELADKYAPTCVNDFTILHAWKPARKEIHSIHDAVQLLATEDIPEQDDEELEEGEEEEEYDDDNDDVGGKRGHALVRFMKQSKKKKNAGMAPVVVQLGHKLERLLQIADRHTAIEESNIREFRFWLSKLPNHTASWSSEDQFEVHVARSVFRMVNGFSADEVVEKFSCLKRDVKFEYIMCARFPCDILRNAYADVVETRFEMNLQGFIDHIHSHEFKTAALDMLLAMHDTELCTPDAALKAAIDTYTHCIKLNYS